MSELDDYEIVSYDIYIEGNGKGEAGNSGSIFFLSGNVINTYPLQTGDTIVYTDNGWETIPSGDDIEDTWRPVSIAGTALTSVESLAIVAGEKIRIDRNDAGTFVINAIAPDIPLATLHQDGALVSLPGLIKPVADKFEVEEGVVTKISTDLLANGAEELVLYGGNAETGITA